MEEEFIQNKPRSFTAKCLSQTQVVYLEYADFL